MRIEQRTRKNPLQISFTNDSTKPVDFSLAEMSVGDVRVSIFSSTYMLLPSAIQTIIIGAVLPAGEHEFKMQLMSETITATITVEP
jgi:hypothetical protein